MKIKLFYSIIVDVPDGDVINAYAVNHPDDNFKPEFKLTQEMLERNKHVHPDLQGLLHIISPNNFSDYH